MHFLLDTNILIGLIREAREEYLLNQFIDLVEEGIIKLLIPDTLIREWEQKKKQTLGLIEKTFSDAAGFASAETIATHLKTEYEVSCAKAEQIDRLLEKGISFNTGDGVKVETVNRSTAHKAPFHNDKTKSINDALLYFATIEFLRNNKIGCFVFVTKNVNDFGDEQKKTELLHPDLIVAGIKTLFFPSLGKCFQQLKGELFVNAKSSTKEATNMIQVVKRKPRNLLDHLYQVIQTYREHIPFLPTHLISQLEPFRIAELPYDYSYHMGDTLYTNNKAIVEFFTGVNAATMRFKRGAGFSNTSDNLQKLRYVIAALNQNFVLNIAYVAGGDQISIRRGGSGTCNCARCTYNSLSLEALETSLGKEESSLKKAFVLFQLGRYNDAFLQYHQCYKASVKEKRKADAFRLRRILEWVADHANVSEADANVQRAIDEIKKDNIEKLFDSLFAYSPLDRELAFFLHRGTFFDHFRLRISEHLEEIRRHYQSQLKGGYGSNSNYSNLVNTFLAFEEFTWENGMAYTRYSEFHGICDQLTEGIFLSYALNEYQVAGISHFDDFVLDKLLFYGKADEMIKYFNKYIKQPIAYKSREKLFETKAMNFLSSKISTIDHFSTDEKWEQSAFFYRILWNLVFLLAVIDFEKEFVRRCAEKLLPFLERLPKREHHSLNHFASFIDVKGKILGKVLLHSLFQLCLSNSTLHRDVLFEKFSKLSKYAPVIVRSRREFDAFCQLFLETCPKCGQNHHVALFYLFKLLSQKWRVEVSKNVVLRLSAQFDHKLYYRAVMYDMIDFRPQFNQYLSLFTRPEKAIRHSLFLTGEVDYRGINDLMNLVFKTASALPEEVREELRGLSSYYDWVMDMENFDYSKFKPLWVMQYATRYYLQHAFSIEKLRTAVRHYLQKNEQPLLAYYYSQYVN